jgi:hypothetical protein
MRAARVSAVLAFAALAASGPALFAQSAAALEPGVHVDPGSPAAKEYALPVSQARGAGGGSEGSHEQLFGAGIKPPSSGSPRGGSPRGGSAGSGSARGGSPSSPTARRGASKAAGAASPRSAAGTGATRAIDSQPTPSLVRRAADRQSSSDGGSSWPVLLGGGVLVLVLGAFAGVVLRHGRRATSAA